MTAFALKNCGFPWDEALAGLVLATPLVLCLGKLALIGLYSSKLGRQWAESVNSEPVNSAQMAFSVSHSQERHCLSYALLGSLPRIFFIQSSLHNSSWRISYPCDVGSGWDLEPSYPAFKEDEKSLPTPSLFSITELFCVSRNYSLQVWCSIYSPMSGIVASTPQRMKIIFE